MRGRPGLLFFVTASAVTGGLPAWRRLLGITGTHHQKAQLEEPCREAKAVKKTRTRALSPVGFPLRLGRSYQRATWRVVLDEDLSGSALQPRQNVARSEAAVPLIID